jgi:hypothetical protein
MKFRATPQAGPFYVPSPPISGRWRGGGGAVAGMQNEPRAMRILGAKASESRFISPRHNATLEPRFTYDLVGRGAPRGSSPAD